jgi:hypothetical protein
VFFVREELMLEKRFLAIALGASVIAPQIAIASASAASCKCVTKHTHRRVIKRVVSHTKPKTITKVVYRDRVITQPVVINNYPTVTPAPEVTTRVIEQPAVIAQPVVVPRVNTFGAVVEPRPYYGAPTYVRPGFGHPVLRGAIGGGVLGGALGAGTGAIIGGLSRHHRAGRGALAGLGIGAGVGALLGGLSGASQTRLNAGLGTPWF